MGPRLGGNGLGEEFEFTVDSSQARAKLNGLMGEKDFVFSGRRSTFVQEMAGASK